MPATGRTRLVVRAALALYLAGLLALTMSPQPDDPTAFGWVRRAVEWVAAHGVPVTFPAVEAVGNLLLFVPFGVLAGLLLPVRRWWVVLVAGAALSAAIELIQLAIPGRWTTLQDWVLNTAGTALGLAVLFVVRGGTRAEDATRAGSQGVGIRPSSARDVS